jgi:hypothetical protein
MPEMGSTGVLRLQTITAMAHCQTKSIEELRYEVGLLLFPIPAHSRAPIRRLAQFMQTPSMQHACRDPPAEHATAEHAT